MNVLISGYYGFGNWGDEALLSGILRALERGGHRITVLSNDPAATGRLHGVRAVHRTWGAPTALLAADALISGGGGLLQDKTSFRSLQYYLSLIRLAKLLGKRVIIYGQSVGPLSERGRRAVALTLRDTAVAVRDRASQQRLASLGVDTRLVADGALLLSLRAASGDGPLLLIPRSGYSAITDALTELARNLMARGQRVAATAVQPSEDEAELRAMTAALPGLERLEADSLEALCTHIAGASYVVSGRLHGLVLAAAAGVGFAGLIYDPKVAAFLQEAGAPAFDLPVDTAALERVALERPLPEAAKRAALIERAETGATWLVEQLAT